MTARTTATVKSFAKMLLYTAIFVALTEISEKGTILLDWRTVGIAAAVAAAKGALTWLKTEA